jgi:hypothetical protein
MFDSSAETDAVSFKHCRTYEAFVQKTRGSYFSSELRVQSFLARHILVCRPVYSQ